MGEVVVEDICSAPTAHRMYIKTAYPQETVAPLWIEANRLPSRTPLCQRAASSPSRIVSDTDDDSRSHTPEPLLDRACPSACSTSHLNAVVQAPLRLQSHRVDHAITVLSPAFVKQLLLEIHSLKICSTFFRTRGTAMCSSV